MKLLFVGDVMLGRLVNEVLKTAPPSYPWGNTLSIFRQADLRICNLECVISDLGQPWSQTYKVFHFRSDAKNIEVLRQANINVVSLANNHTLDFEYEAMFEMLEILDKNAILHAGAGKNIDEAQKRAILQIDNFKIGFLSFTDNEHPWEATEQKAGIYYVPIDITDKRAANLLKYVNNVKNTVDFLIVSVHWGPNWGHIPPDDHIVFGHALIDAGADVIHGHSAHIFRAVEIYKGKLIMYSTGNFIDDYEVDEIERNDWSFIFILETEKEKLLNLYLYPTVIRNFQACRAKGKESEQIASKMKDLCEEFGVRIRRTKKFLQISISE